MMEPLVTVIVPVRNEARCIARTLDALLAQSFPPDQFEILVIDGASEDHTRQIVRDYERRSANVSLLLNPAKLSSAARNIGVRSARGEYILVVDGHCEIRDPHYLSKLVAAFEESGADCLGRPQPLQAPQPTPFQQAVALARQSWLGHNPDSAIFSDRAGFVPAQNVAVAYRREVFVKAGLFDERFDACEDVEFNSPLDRIGLTCFFTPSIRVDYHPRSSLRGLMYQMQRYGQGRARLARKSPATVSLPALVPPLFLLWLAATAVLGFAHSAFWLMAAATLFSYLVVVLGESARLARGRIVGATARLPFVFFGIHFGFAWGYLKEIARPPQLGNRFRLNRTAITQPERHRLVP